MTTLVTGATGAVGSELLQILTGAGEPVRAAGRRPEAISAPDGVEVVHLDLGAPAGDARAALRGVDAVFLYADPEGIDALAPELREAGIRVVLLSSDSVTLPDAESNVIARMHLDVERALAAAGVPCTAVRPGTFDSLATGWAAAIRGSGEVHRAYPDVVLSPVHPTDIADVAAALLLSDGGGAPVTLHGPEPLTPRDQLAVLADVLGTPVEVVEAPVEEARAELAAAIGPGRADALISYWAYAATTPASAEDTAERITGRPARTFRQWCEENRAAFA